MEHSEKSKFYSCYLCIHSADSADFEILTFTQTWPITECVDWRDRKDSNECALPPKRDIWIIHGIWPSNTGKNSPEFCQNGEKLNMNELEPLMDRMKIYWPKIHKSKFYYSAHLILGYSNSNSFCLLLSGTWKFILGVWME